MGCITNRAKDAQQDNVFLNLASLLEMNVQVP